MAVNFSTIKGPIRGVDFTEEHQIIIYYDDRKIILGYTIDCCESEISWFERADMNDLYNNNIEIDENYISFDDIAGNKIICISVVTNIKMKKSNREMFDINHLYKIDLRGDKYSYLLLRCSSDGYYDSSLITTQILKK